MYILIYLTVHKYICSYMYAHISVVSTLWVLQHSYILHALLAFSYIFLLLSLQEIEWQLEMHYFCGEDYSWTSCADKLSIDQSSSATMFSWTVCHVTAFLVLLSVTSALILCANNSVLPFYYPLYCLFYLQEDLEQW